ncbi:MAG: lasso peptide biosynthesis B2 protein [Pseudomonadota bacterium]
MGHRTRLVSRRASAPALASGGEQKLYWRLSDTITACVAHRRVIILDVANDRYRALPEADEPPFIRWLSAPASPPPPPCRDSLIALGIDQARLEDIRAVACSIRMPLPLDPDPIPQIRLSASVLSGVAQCLVPAWHAVRSHRLGRALAKASTSMKGAGPPHHFLPSKLAQFQAARPFIPVPRVCLHDCLALVDWLGPGSGAELVLGVSPYPFNAHCWVQANGRVIDDHPQSPSRFHPILHLE